MNNEVKVTNIKSLIITFAIILTVITVGTFAWLSYRSKSTAMVLTIGDINDMQITLKPYQLDLELSPVLTYTSLDANEEYVTVTVVNNSTEERYYSLYYDIEEIDNSLTSADFKYTALRTNDNNIITGDFAGANTTDEFYILRETSIPANTTYNYKVYTWLDGTNNPNVANDNFKGEIRAELYGENPPTTPLPTFIRNNGVMDNIASTYVTNSRGIQFNTISSDTNGKGLYIRSGTQNDVYPIYYYRGAVTNNYVYFAGYCWQIIRTTETGGLKLIYYGEKMSNGSCSSSRGFVDTTIGYGSYNANYDSVTDVGYKYGTRYAFADRRSNNLATAYKYGNSVTYANSKYTLVNTITSSGSWANDYNTLDNNHYTCFNTTGTCSSVYYIFYTSQFLADTITLTGGKTIETALAEMLSNSSNATSSTIKTAADNWYAAHLTSYSSYLEDTIWCNDRSISKLAGWNPNGGDTESFLEFSGYKRLTNTYNPIVTCPNKNDSFTVTETTTGNGALTYPIGFVTIDELMLAGMTADATNNTSYISGSYDYWTMTPYDYEAHSYVAVKENSEKIMPDDVRESGTDYVPCISLKNGLIYSGSGTKEDPYTVSLS